MVTIGWKTHKASISLQSPRFQNVPNLINLPHHFAVTISHCRCCHVTSLQTTYTWSLATFNSSGFTIFHYVSPCFITFHLPKDPQWFGRPFAQQYARDLCHPLQLPKLECLACSALRLHEYLGAPQREHPVPGGPWSPPCHVFLQQWRTLFWHTVPLKAFYNIKLY